MQIKTYKIITTVLVTIVIILPLALWIYEIIVPNQKLVICDMDNESISRCLSIPIEKHYYLISPSIDHTVCEGTSIEKCYALHLTKENCEKEQLNTLNVTDSRLIKTGIEITTCK